MALLRLEHRHRLAAAGDLDRGLHRIVVGSRHVGGADEVEIVARDRIGHARLQGHVLLDLVALHAARADREHADADVRDRHAEQARRERLAAAQAAAPARSSAEKMIQKPNTRPTSPTQWNAAESHPLHEHGQQPRPRRAATRAALPTAVSLPRRQAECMPIARNTMSGSIGTRNMTANTGGPTEILPRFKQLVHQRRQRAPQHQPGDAHQDHVVDQEEELARERLEAARGHTASARARRRASASRRW